MHASLCSPVHVRLLPVDSYVKSPTIPSCLFGVEVGKHAILLQLHGEFDGVTYIIEVVEQRLYLKELCYPLR